MKRSFEQLVLDAKSGDKAAMNEVMKYMYKAIYNDAKQSWKEIPGGLELKDIVQIAMIKVYRAIEKYDSSISAINWLMLNGRNEIISHCRSLNYIKRKANLGHDSMDRDISNSSDGTITVGNVLPGAEDTENEAISNVVHENLLIHLIRKLSPMEKKVFDYMILEYASNEEIGAAIGCSAKAVDNTKLRIKLKARQILDVI